MQKQKIRLQRWVGATLILLLPFSATACAGENLRPFARTAANPCPPWVAFPADRNSNAETPYLGCSNEFNLRATLEEPQDLERGRALAPADGVRESGAVELYANGPRKPLAASGPATPTVMLSGSEGAGK